MVKSLLYIAKNTRWSKQRVDGNVPEVGREVSLQCV